MPAPGFLTRIITSFFFIGYLPLMPGTFGSLAGLVIGVSLSSNRLFYLAFTFIALAAGLLLGSRMEKLSGRKDPPQVVIDEVAGMLISMAFIPLTPLALFWAFFLFRAFDTIKPFPVNRLQHLEGGAGIMLDDVIAGLYANLVLQVALRLIA